MIEKAKAMIAAEHGVMPEMDDHMDVELQDGSKDAGIGVHGVSYSILCTLCAMRPVVITNINQCIFLFMLADD
jgi:hypothetical protein